MPRFSVAFNKRKSAADLLENVQPASPAQSSFRVIERKDVPNHSNNRSFDGGAKYSRPQASVAPVAPAPRPQHLDIADDNMFADLKVNRGSNISNTTHATSDNSSRHSNASTAPSSADMAQVHAHDDSRKNKPIPPVPEDSQQPARGPSTKSISASLFKAGRTFSFGGQKKQSISPPKEEPLPDLPPVLTLNTSATAPAGTGFKSPTEVTSASSPDAAIDMGGDFSAMFSGMDKRQSVAANGRSLTGARNAHNASASPEVLSPSEPFLPPSYSPDEDRTLSFKRSTPTQHHYSGRPADIVEDEDAKLLRDSFTAMKFLSGDSSNTNNNANSSGSLHRRQNPREDTLPSRPIAASFAQEDNMFDESASRFARVSHRYVPRVPIPPKHKVMTPAQFEQYKQDKERQSVSSEAPAAKAAAKQQQQQDEDEEDEINYDDDEDEAEKSRQQTKQRRKQEAHMAVYRQQMMKVTGEPAIITPSSRPGLPSVSSAPQLHTLKTPSPNLPSDEDDDEEVPLAILQAHGFPAKNRPPTRLSTIPSSNTLAPPPHNQGRPASVVGDNSGNGNGRRQSNLPAFARNLPQDPFVGASVSKPAIRESMSFHENGNQQQQNHGPLPPGGLVGVIASEERSRAMRRGSPNIDNNRGFNRSPTMPYGQGGFDPSGGMPQHAMYNQGGMPHSMSQMSLGGMPGMPGMPQPMLSPGDQAQMQMNQQMQQFMQMQMQWMQMMAMNQGGGGAMPPGMPPGMQMPQMQGMPGMPHSGYAAPASQSMTDLSGRQSVMAEPNIERLNHGMRTMSMVQPSSASMLGGQGFGGPGSIRGMNGPGYAPSIAPSERSIVGLPGRYRPVSHAPSTPRASDHSDRTATMSGAFPSMEVPKSRASVSVVPQSTEGSDDDDDEEGWEAMKARREKKKSFWRSKKTPSTSLSAVI